MKLDPTFQHLDDNEDEEPDDESNSDLESLDDETKRAHIGVQWRTIKNENKRSYDWKSDDLPPPSPPHRY
jgi:hypothetical protein